MSRKSPEKKTGIDTGEDPGRTRNNNPGVSKLFISQRKDHQKRPCDSKKERHYQARGLTKRRSLGGGLIRETTQKISKTIQESRPINYPINHPGTTQKNHPETARKPPRKTTRIPPRYHPVHPPNTTPIPPESPFRGTPPIPPGLPPKRLLTTLERKILVVIESEPAVSRKEIANVLNISPETVKKYIKKLKRKSVLRRVGPAKGGHWEVV